MLAESVNGSLDVAYHYGDDLISQSRIGSVRYFHVDGLGSTRVLTDSSGSQTDGYAYAAFGEVLVQDGVTDNSYLYTGEQYNANLDQYYLRARYYDQGVGRFTQMDSWMGNNADPITLHKYVYANVDPGDVTDPTGNFGLMSFSAANSIRFELSSIQIDVGTSLLDTALDPAGAAQRGPNNMLLGVASLGGPAAFKLLRMLSGKFRKACSANSFTGETLVSTEMGLIPISEIENGDLIWAYNEETGESSLQEVIHLIRGEGVKDLVDIILANDKFITATSGHPMYSVTRGGWVEAGELGLDDSMLRIDGEALHVSGIQKYTRESIVFNLTVAFDHTYYVSDDEVLAHNSGVCKFPEISVSSRNHILKGEILAGGKITGYHHRFGGQDSGSLKLVRILGRSSGKNKSYNGIVEYIDGNGKRHTKKSSFFPNSWTAKRVMDEVTSAVIAAASKGKLSGTVRAKGASGLLVEMKIRNGRLESAYPVVR